jgi:hypothetical protein
VTLAYQLGEALSDRTDHYLLMTATPHKGDPENFCLFLGLLDRDVYGDVQSLEQAMKKHEAPFYLRRIKEALVTFPDPDTGRVKTLFTKRNVQTTEFRIDDEEWDFYDALTHLARLWGNVIVNWKQGWFVDGGLPRVHIWYSERRYVKP